eukprot:CAMPEP_0194399648 /NCGR_PEP_ID=MMETSP0174-20130528/126774_1 /TAXON_ID=216777 /ORGANISM="Proboscia alata, Strain PI-D3" /LENGTH=1267 /DNA_ID=CAMNT_0039196075 /DNA_START=47 /DNA_END=3850 /DNA_ORIENTATION=-
MVEEALSSPENYSPYDTALTILQYIHHDLSPTGGSGATASEYRFCTSLYPRILQRIYGELIWDNDLHLWVHDDGSNRVSGTNNRSGGGTNPSSNRSGSVDNAVPWLLRQKTCPAVMRSHLTNNAAANNNGNNNSISRRRITTRSGALQVDPVIHLLLPSSQIPIQREKLTFRNAVTQSAKQVVGRSSQYLVNSGISGSDSSKDHTNRNYGSTAAGPNNVTTSTFGAIGTERNNNDALMAMSTTTLFDVISMETESRPGVNITFPFIALPLPTQQAMRLLIEEQALGLVQNAAYPPRSNAARLCGYLLRIRPSQQLSLVEYIQRDLQQRQQMQQRMPHNIHQVSFNNRSSNPSSFSPSVNNAHFSPSSPQRQQHLMNHNMSYQHSPSLANALPSANNRKSSNGPSPSSKGDKDNLPSIMLTMREYYLLLFSRYPHASGRNVLLLKQQLQQQKDQIQQQQQSSKVGGQQRSTTGAVASTSARGPETYGESSYLYLLKKYLAHFFPHVKSISDNSSSISSFGAFRRTSTNDTNINVNSSGGPGLYLFQPLDRPSELFLSLLIEFWIENENIPAPTSCHINSYTKSEQQDSFHPFTSPQSYERNINNNGHRETRTTSDNATTSDNNALTNAYDNTKLLASSPNNQSSNSGVVVPPFYHRTPSLILRGTRILIHHVVSDPNLHNQMVTMQQHRIQNQRSSTNSSSSEWCLTPAMTCLQPSIYNFIRLAFRYSQIHAKQSAFYTALDVWLMWLEPWNYVKRNISFSAAVAKNNFNTEAAKDILYNKLYDNNSSNGTGASSTSSNNINIRPTSPSQYTPEWAPYIVANLHMYTTPLAIFLRRSRELQFSGSGSGSDSNRSISIIQRVFRIFSPQVVKVINDHANFGPKDSTAATVEMKTNSMSNIDNFRNNGNSHDSTYHHDQNGAVQQSLFYSPLRLEHERILGEYSPTTNTNTTTSGGSMDLTMMMTSVHLSGCQKDLNNLIEELLFQHSKKVSEFDFWDRLDDKLQYLAGGGTKKDLAVLDRLLQQIQIIGGVSSADLQDVMMQHNLDCKKASQSLFFSSSPNNTHNTNNETAVMTTSTRLRKQQQQKRGLEGQHPHHLPDRNLNGWLTTRGRRDIVNGNKQCSVIALPLIGDPMMSRVKSYEVAFLVHLSQVASIWLNCQLGLDGHSSSSSNSTIFMDNRFGDKQQQQQHQPYNLNLFFFFSFINKVAKVLLKLVRKVRDGDAATNAGIIATVIPFRINLRFLADSRLLVLLFTIVSVRAIFAQVIAMFT